VIRVAPLRYDTVFKKAFGKPEVFCQFVKDVLGVEIHVERVIPGWRYPEPVGFVDIEYDLFAEDTQKRIIVELQHVREEDLFDRFLYYHLIALVEQVKSYADYQFDKTVYTVVLVTGKSIYENIPEFSYAVSNMDAVNEFGESLSVYPHRLVFLNPRFLNEKTPESIKVWLELIADSMDEQLDETRYTYPTLKKVIDEIKSDNITPQELKVIKDEAAWEQTKRNAFEEGHEKGLQEGRQEGLDEGRRQEKKGIVISMLQKGIELNLIAEITGLELEDIEDIKSRNITN